MGVLTRISGGDDHEKKCPNGKLARVRLPDGNSIPKEERTAFVEQPKEKRGSKKTKPPKRSALTR